MSLGDHLLRDEDHWKTLRVVASAAADTYPTELNPSDYAATYESKSVIIDPGSEITVSFFGQGTNDGTVNASFIGWMSPYHRYRDVNEQGFMSPGPGFPIYSVTLTLANASTINEEILPDGNWAVGTGGAWMPSDTLTRVAAQSLFAATDVIAKTQASPATNLLILPCIRFSAITLLFDTFSNVTKMGCIYRRTGLEVT